MVHQEFSEEGRKARFEQWEEYGLERLKSDLQTDPYRRVGSGPLQRLAWEWVRLKEAEQTKVGMQTMELSKSPAVGAKGRRKPWGLLDEVLSGKGPGTLDYAPRPSVVEAGGFQSTIAEGPPRIPPDHKSLLDWAGSARVTLAVVFTDIVDSTALGIELGDSAMGDVRRKHFAQSAALLARYAGREIKTIGDSVMAVFRSVEAALYYARALQFDPGSPELQVRAGIHIGSLEVTEEDIFGTEVAVASRVVSAIAGAEIWLSSRAKDDIDRAGTHREEGWEWRPHDVNLKGIGNARLWSLIVEPTRGSTRTSKRVPSVERGSALKISAGEAGPYLQTRGRGLRSTIRTLNLRLDNNSQNDAVTGIKIIILSIEPQQEYTGPWILVENLSLAAGDHCFIPLVCYQEAANESGYSTNRYERSATFLEILSTHTQPKPSRDIPQFVTIRATGFGSAPCDYKCKIWVDRPDGRLRIADAEC
jgi:class 3 adenylate cyclase